MSENLYAPPQAELGTGASQALGTGELDIGRCLSEGWARTWSNFPLWLGAGIVWVFAMTAMAVTIIGIFVGIPVLYWGGYAFGLRMYDGGASAGVLFSGFSHYGRALGGMLLLFGVSFLLSLPGGIISAIANVPRPPSLALGALGNLISMAISLFVSTRLSFIPYLMIDRDLSFGDALSLAWSRTDPVKWKVVLLALVMVAVGVAGFIALIVGVFPAMVMIFLMSSSAYRQIFGGAPPAAA